MFKCPFCQRSLNPLRALFASRKRPHICPECSYKSRFRIGFSLELFAVGVVFAAVLAVLTFLRLPASERYPFLIVAGVVPFVAGLLGSRLVPTRAATVDKERTMEPESAPRE